MRSTAKAAPKKFAIVGFGAITREMIRTLEDRGQLDALGAVLVRSERLALARAEAAGRFLVVDDIDALAADVVVECAGHDCVRELGPRIVARGCDLIISSVGALARPGVTEHLLRAARNGAALLIPSGAVAGIDGLLAARTAGLQRVVYTSVKPPTAWDGTPAADQLVGRRREVRTPFFSGSAREAAIAYPRNANVGATVALASLGMDRTRVELVSDPTARGPLGIIEAEGAFGVFRFEILAYASASNPKTSLLTAHSLLLAATVGMSFSVTAACGA
jgi:aspartate dehydrogenase